MVLWRGVMSIKVRTAWVFLTIMLSSARTQTSAQQDLCHGNPFPVPTVLTCGPCHLDGTEMFSQERARASTDQMTAGAPGALSVMEAGGSPGCGGRHGPNIRRIR